MLPCPRGGDRRIDASGTAILSLCDRVRIPINSKATPPRRRVAAVAATRLPPRPPAPAHRPRTSLPQPRAHAGRPPGTRTRHCASSGCPRKNGLADGGRARCEAFRTRVPDESGMQVTLATHTHTHTHTLRPCHALRVVTNCLPALLGNGNLKRENERRRRRRINDHSAMIHRPLSSTKSCTGTDKETQTETQTLAAVFPKKVVPAQRVATPYTLHPTPYTLHPTPYTLTH